jgi:hypothetical protein
MMEIKIERNQTVTGVAKMTDPRQTKDQRINLAIAYISKEELKSV